MKPHNAVEPITYTEMESPIGRLRVARSRAGYVAIGFDAANRPAPPSWQRADEAGDAAVAQLRAYFAGRLRTFDLPLAPTGTPFQQEVWSLLRQIPYGTTISYAELAARLGRPETIRAVGAANGRNPLPIVVPCHRVIGSDGRLTGYAGGLPVKEALLALEGWRGNAAQMSLF